MSQEYEYPCEPGKPTKKERSWLGTVVVALSCALIGGVLGAVLAGQGSQSLSAERPISGMLQGYRENAVIQVEEIDTSEEMTPAQVYAANVNSTVGITTAITTNYWGYQTTSAASGSGFIISHDGYILTNYHVIEGANKITVSLYSGKTYDAKLIGYDESNDIAVLKIDETGLPPVILGDSDNLNVGDYVLAIGNPLGELTFSLTAGTVSAKDREVTFSGNVTMRLIQTDCAINSGNSGGALFNLHGEVIGVTNAKYSGASNGGASIDNIGFAIPMNRIRPIVESIIEKGYVSEPYIGVSIFDVSQEYQQMGLPMGAAVQSVAKDSPAQKAGLQVGDIVTQANGEEITGGSDLKEIISQSQAGRELKLEIYRQGDRLELTVTVGEQIKTAAR